MTYGCLMRSRRSVALLGVAIYMTTAIGAAPKNQEREVDSRPTLGAGFRYSTYGPAYHPGPEYWAQVGEAMAKKFPQSRPETVWIVCPLADQGCELSFPADPEDPRIRVSATDLDEATLDLFDQRGFGVWLQVEPGNASVVELIDLVLERYSHHPSVVGFGVDVEWYRSVDQPKGQAVTDAEAREWLAAIRAHDPNYRLFLKHWEIEKMPPTERDGLLFIDDSQIFPSLDAMVEEFRAWGRAFAPAPVGFQVGYPADQHWWQDFADPPRTIGDRLRSTIPNTEGLYWVDFTALDVFPPPKKTSARQAGVGSRPMLGVKAYDPEIDPGKLVAEWSALGIDTAFVSEELAAVTEFRQAAADAQISIFLIAPVFFDPAALEQDPELFAVTDDGRRAEDSWVRFTCPSRPDYRRQRVAEIVDLVRRLRPDGLSLDFIRHFVFWEMVKPETPAHSLQNACYCSHCIDRFFGSRYQAKPSFDTTAAMADWISTNLDQEWTTWKTQLITSMATDIVAAVRELDPSLMINLHAVPWRSEDYQGAIVDVAGQDFRWLSNVADFVSPMTYAFMLQRPPSWIPTVVQDLAQRSASSIIPSVQVANAYREDTQLSVEEFEQSLRRALEPPADGVVLWSWEALSKSPEKRSVVRQIFSQVSR